MYILKNKFNRTTIFKKSGLINRSAFKRISKNNNCLLKRGDFYKPANVRPGVYCTKNLIYYK